jgi:hypothetical protein
MRICIFILTLFALFNVSAIHSQTDWHHPLYMDNGDYWRQRIEIRAENTSNRAAKGDPVTLVVGNGENQLQIVGEQAQSLRLINSDDIQFKFCLSDPQGNPIRRGPIPQGSLFNFPAECPAKSETILYLYFDNPSAWAMDDILKNHRDVLNGGFEQVTGTTPNHWQVDWPDDDQRVEWVEQNPRSGEKCLHATIKQNKKETEPVGAMQEFVHIMSGLDYTLEGWVKAENVDGQAGWQIELGRVMATSGEYTQETHKAGAGGGTFAWKKVSVDFTAPEGVNSAHVKTVLDGSGQAWFDDVRLVLHSPYPFRATATPPEKMLLGELGETKDWLQQPLHQHFARTTITVLNLSDQTMNDKPVLVNIEELLNRLYKKIDDNPLIKVAEGQTPIPHHRFGHSLVFKADLPAKSKRTYYVYFSEQESTPDLQYQRLIASRENLVQNGDFENNETGWQKLGKSENLQIANEAKLGGKSLKITLDENQKNTVAGFQQTVDVNPKSKYLLSAWVKCADLQESDIRLQADFLVARGKPLESEKEKSSTDDDQRVFGELKVMSLQQSSSIGASISGDADWTFIHGTIEIPKEARKAQIKLERDSRPRQGTSLTQNQKVQDSPGTVWYDGVYFAEIVTGTALPMNMERKAAGHLTDLTVWPVNSIVKVFQDDLPPAEIPKPFITVAKNESEPLQLAIRAPEMYTDMRAQVELPRNDQGNVLDDINVGVVGYVPINRPSNYYRNRLPFWHLKYPTTGIGSDGWRGWWPDPILPTQSFDLAAHTTQPIWIDITVPKDAPPGDYQGQVWLVDDDQLIKEIPFTVRVWDFELPDERHVGAIYDLRFPERTYYDVKETEQALIEDIWGFMSRHRLCADVIHPDPEITVENGDIEFDFTEYDKAAEYYFDELNMPYTYTPWQFYLFGWELPPKEKFGQEPYPGEYPYKDADRGKLRPEYKKAYQTALRIYWNHMKEKGWADKVILYICDEPFTAPVVKTQMRALCDMIHEVDPEIPIYVSTWWYRPEYKGYIDVWGVANSGEGWGRPVPVKDLREILNSGERIIFTTDGRFCTDTPYNAIERMLPHYAFKYGAEAYEFWGLNFYSFNPFQYSWHRFRFTKSAPDRFYWVRWPNGDGYLIYPGKLIGHDGIVPTIRIKQAREGSEDYEYFYLLQNLITEAKSMGTDTSNASDALEQAKTLVQIPSAGGRYSTRFLDDPDAVLQAKENVAKAIETLMKRLY